MSLRKTAAQVLGALAPLRLAGERLTIAGFMVAALVLILASRGSDDLVERSRLLVRDPLVPVLAALQVPMDLAGEIGRRLGGLLAVYRENERLKAENAALRAREVEAVRLAVENRSLREVLRMPKAETEWERTTGRLIADSAGSFVHTRLLDTGSNAGIDEGMPVVTADGLVGRVIGAGRRSARIMLLTDFNSKIPVLVEGSGDQALLVGDNTAEPKLDFLPLDPRFDVGDRVLTSGSGGVLPPGLIVGEISRLADGVAVVRPYVDWARLDAVSVLRYRPLPPPEADDAARPTSGMGVPLAQVTGIEATN